MCFDFYKVFSIIEVYFKGHNSMSDGESFILSRMNDSVFQKIICIYIYFFFFFSKDQLFFDRHNKRRSDNIRSIIHDLGGRKLSFLLHVVYAVQSMHF